MTTITLTEQEAQVILAALPAAWTEEGSHPNMVALKKKLHAIKEEA